MKMNSDDTFSVVIAYKTNALLCWSDLKSLVGVDLSASAAAFALSLLTPSRGPDFGPETSADTMTNMAAPRPHLRFFKPGGSPRRPIGSSERRPQRADLRCSRPDAAKTPGQGGMDI